MYFDTDFQKEKSKEAKRSSNRFSWHKAARETMLAYEWALEADSKSNSSL